MDDYRKLRKYTILNSSLDFPALIGKIQQINGSINGRQWHSPAKEVHEAVNGFNAVLD